MASGTYEETSWGWQLQQFSQQLGEWIERLFSQSRPNSPGLPVIPDWLLKTLFWLMVIAAIGWASWQLYHLLSPYLTHRWRSTAIRQSASLTQSQHSATEWLQQARTAQQQGNYREACIALYMAALQQLNDRGMISQEASRTDGEYLTLLQRQNLPQPYQVLIQTHERLCFDRVIASAEICDSCWQAYQEIERS